MTKIAVLLACHNRRQATLACLDAVHGQQGAGAQLEVLLLDDASTDGTAEAVSSRYPGVRIFRGDGHRWWNGGMRIVFAKAMEVGYDHYLWLNDDTVLDPSAVATLLDVHSAVASPSRPGIVVGSTRDPQDGRLTYGGVRRPDRGRPLRFVLVPPGDVPAPVETMNGNCVLVPDAVARKVGNLDQAYTHAMGDHDYGLRARAAGCEVWLAPGTLGTCAANPRPEPTSDPATTQIRAVLSERQLPPSDWKVFARRWAGPLWPLYWASPYVKRTGTIMAHHAKKLAGGALTRS